MPQASVLQTIQLGLELSPGVDVPANRKLGSLSIDPALQIETDPFVPAGMKYNTLVNLNREWISAGLSGRPTYSELPYILASIIGKTTPTVEGTGASEWTFAPESDAASDPQTFTVEQIGTDGFASQFTYGLITDFNMNISRTGIDLGGTMIGQAYEAGITPTADPTEIELIPVLPSQVSVYMDDDYADIGTTKLTSAFTANFTLNGVYGPSWPLDAAQESFAQHVDLAPTLSLGIQLERNTVGLTPLAALRTGGTKYIRVQAVGPEVETGVNNTLTIDFAGKVSATTNGDTDGLAVIDWTFTGVHDADFGAAFSIAVINGVAAL